MMLKKGLLSERYKEEGWEGDEEEEEE